MIERVAIFDFDGTLVDTPLPDFGKVEYQRVTGEKWPHRGWWGRPETLDQKVFAMPVIPSVYDAFWQEYNTPNTHMVMMTGRIKQLEKEVKAILDEKRLLFHEYIFNWGGATLAYKLKNLAYLKNKFPTIKSMAMWDDRDAHVEEFIKWGKTQDDITFQMTLVPSTHHGE